MDTKVSLKRSQAFISYGRKESRAFAAKLYHRLKEIGIQSWFDQNDIPLGIDFQDQIDDGIEKADNFIYIMAPHSIQSPYCGKEIDLALSSSKRIIPIMHIEPQTKDMWEMIRPQVYQINWIYMRQKFDPSVDLLLWEDLDDFETKFADLVKLLRSQENYVAQHTEILTKAIEWERHQKRRNYLLLGEDRLIAEKWLNTEFNTELPPCRPSDLHAEFICESKKNANRMFTEAFFCFASDDLLEKNKIQRELEKHCITTWTNIRDIKPGEKYSEAIKEGIEQTNTLVFLISNQSLLSEYCLFELKYAKELNKQIIPVLIEEVDKNNLPDFLQQLQYISIVNSKTVADKEKKSDFLQKTDELVAAIHSDMDYFEQHKQVLVQALTWSRNHKDNSLLYYGKKLEKAENWITLTATRPENNRATTLQNEFILSSRQCTEKHAAEIFITYDSSDLDFASLINHELQNYSRSTWIDLEDITATENIVKEVEHGIENADNLLFILSPGSVKSQYCIQQFNLAAQQNKRVITVLYNDVNEKDIPAEFSSNKWIDFQLQRAEFQKSFADLLRTLDTDREHVRLHTRWQQRAREWDKNNRNSDLLLRGTEYQMAMQWINQAQNENKSPKPTSLQMEYFAKSKQAIERIKKIWKAVQITITGLLIISVILGIVANFQRKKAEKNWRLSQSNLYANLSAQELTKDHTKSYAYADSAIQFSPQNQTALTAQLNAWFQTDAFYKTLNSFSYGVNWMDISPDENTFALACNNAMIHLVKPDGSMIKTLKGHDADVLSVNFSTDGKYLVSGGRDSLTILWDANGNLIRKIKIHNGSVLFTVFSNDNHLILSAGEDSVALLCDLTGKIIARFPHKGMVRCANFSASGELIITCGDDNKAILWDIKGKKLKEFIHPVHVNYASFAPDDKQMVTASGEFNISDYAVRIWNTNGELLNTPIKHSRTIKYAAFSADGQKIISSSFDYTTKIFDLSSDTVRTLLGHTDVVNRAILSKDGKRLYTCSGDKVSMDNTFRVWDLARKNSQITRLPGVTHAVAFSPNGSLFYFAGDNGELIIYHNNLMLSIKKLHRQRINSIVLSPNAKQLLTASDDSTAKISDLKGNLIHEFKERCEVKSACFSPNGNNILISLADGKIKMYECNGKDLILITSHHSQVNQVCFSPDGKNILSASDDSTARIFDISGKELLALRGNAGIVNHITVSPDNRFVVTSQADSVAIVWNYEGNIIARLKLHEDLVNSANFSDDGKYLITSGGMGDRKAILWRTSDFKPVYKFDHVLYSQVKWAGFFGNSNVVMALINNLDFNKYYLKMYYFEN